MFLTRRHVLVALLGIELMLNAAVINFFELGTNEGKISALFVFAIATVETVVALALFVNVWRFVRSPNLDEYDKASE